MIDYFLVWMNKQKSLDFNDENIVPEVQELDIQTEFIKKVGNEWCVFSEEGKNFGCYNTKSQAEKRLQQIHGFSK